MNSPLFRTAVRAQAPFHAVYRVVYFARDRLDRFYVFLPFFIHLFPSLLCTVCVCINSHILSHRHRNFRIHDTFMPPYRPYYATLFILIAHSLSSTLSDHQLLALPQLCFLLTPPPNFPFISLIFC